MRAIKVVAAARRSGIRLSVQLAFQFPTIAGVAVQLEDSVGDDLQDQESGLSAFELLAEEDLAIVRQMQIDDPRDEPIGSV